VSLEKPWDKPFRALLEEFAGFCGGRIEEPDFPPATTHRYVEASTFFYPTLTTSYGGFPLFIEISERPTGTSRAGSGDLEYIRLMVEAPTRYTLAIVQEHLWRKFLKLLGMELDFQTGNDDFDRRYLVVCKSETDRGFLRLTSTQQSIMNLEPFESVEILPKGIRWSQEIRKKSQLRYASLQEHVRLMVELAKNITTTDERRRWPD